jgi:transposase
MGGLKFEVSDELWAKIEPMLPAAPDPANHPMGCHKRRVPNRAALNGIFFVLRTGCQWKALDATKIVSSSSAHRRFQEWTRAGVFHALWTLSIEEYDELKGLDWEWLAMDGAITKAPLGGKRHRK